MARRSVGAAMAVALLALLAGASAQGDCMQDALSRLNFYRAKHGAGPLEWDDALMARERVHVTKLANSGCGLWHSPGPETLSWNGRAVDHACALAVDSWYAEKAWYKFGTSQPFTDNQRNMNQLQSTAPFQIMIGHFTQVVWVGATKVGCFAATSSCGVVVGCAYDAGNNSDDKIYGQNVLPEGTPVSTTRPDDAPVPANQQISQSQCDYAAQNGWCQEGMTWAGTGITIIRLCPTQCGPIVAQARQQQRQQYLDTAAAMGPVNPPNTPYNANAPTYPSGTGNCPTDILGRVNSLRNQYGAANVAWDDTLQASAKITAVDMARRGCSFSPSRFEQFQVTFSIPLPEDQKDVCIHAANSWFNERANINNPALGTASPKDWPMRSQFPQVAWRGATKVGCYVARGPAQCGVVVCKFDKGPGMPSDDVMTQNVVLDSGAPIVAAPAPAFTKDKDAQCKNDAAGGWCLNNGRRFSGENIAEICPESCGPVFERIRQNWISQAAALGPNTPENVYNGGTTSSSRKLLM